MTERAFLGHWRLQFNPPYSLKRKRFYDWRDMFMSLWVDEEREGFRARLLGGELDYLGQKSLCRKYLRSLFGILEGI